MPPATIPRFAFLLSRCSPPRPSPLGPHWRRAPPHRASDAASWGTPLTQPNSMSLGRARWALLSGPVGRGLRLKPHEPFSVLGWNYHLLTIFSAFFRSVPDVRLRRECLRTADDGTVSFDWVAGDERAPLSEAPVVGGEMRVTGAEERRNCRTCGRVGMSSGSGAVVNLVGKPIPTSAVLMASWKHIVAACRAENATFIGCKKDPNPEKCIDKGRQVTSCVLGLLKSLHERCSKEMNASAGCMYYNTDEFEMCRKEQGEFEIACP